MKIFIAGARSIHQLVPAVEEKLYSIYQKNFDVLVGDCGGVDASVQKYFARLNYPHVTVYASNGKTRNNVGSWQIKNIAVADSVKGFDFYRQKDIAMANDADYGIMVWDGKSRGTRSNIQTMVEQGKMVLVVIAPQGRKIIVRSRDDFTRLMEAVNYPGISSKQLSMNL